MSTVFGDVADAYDQVRPAYPSELSGAIAAYAGRVGSVVEIGSGTGLGTEILAALGAKLTCVEPDARMAALLRAKFPHAVVHAGAFEQWLPPAGGVPLLACAMAWHWLDAATRNRLAYDALAPGGTLAVFGHTYDFADPVHRDVVFGALAGVGITAQNRPPGWFHDDIAGSGMWTDVQRQVLVRDVDVPTAHYLALHQTFGTHLRRGPAQQQAELEALRAAIDGLGGVLHMRLPTTLVLARRAARSAGGAGS